MAGSRIRSRAVIGLVLVVPTMLLALAGPVAAAAPLADRWVQEYPLAQNDGLTEACGFTVVESGVQTIQITTFLNADGSVREIVLHDRDTWTETNVATGVSATQSSVRIYFHAFEATPTLVGMPNKVSSGGVAVIDAGLLYWEFPDGAILQIAGPHPTFFNGIDWCGNLGA